MAIYHLSGQIMSRSQGRSAIAAASYRAAEKMVDLRTGNAHDYTKKTDDILYKEILLPKDAPKWMEDREKLWNAVEANEKRKDAQLAREFNISLPKELTPEQNIELAREFVQKEFVDKGMIADLCLHKGHKGGEEQPHIHVMLTLREVTTDGFGKKVREWNDRGLLEEWRQSWAEHANKHLALNGHDISIDHRSNVERGIDLEPQYKIGAKVAQHNMARYEDHQRIARENGEKIFADPKIALDAITKQQSTFIHHDIAKFVNRHTVDSEQFQAVYEKVKAHEQIVYLGKDELNRERYTTQEMLSLEKGMLTTADSLNASYGRQVKLFALPEYFSAEQRAALEHLTDRGDIKCVIGYAGSGKSTILNEARQAWEKAGYNVHGVTLSGIAAENLTGASGIESRTVASRMYYWDRDEQKLTERDVLVVDEAGMLGSRQMARILQEAQDARAKVVLIGDPQQLQAIEAGAAFRAITEKVNYVELTQIHRQHEKWQQEATREFARGMVTEALERYDRKDHLHEYETQSYAKQGLVEMWNDVRISNTDKTQIMLAYTRKDVKDLNEMARELRKSNNELGQDCAIQTVRGERLFAENDRVYFLKNDRGLGVMNGTLGTIEKIDSNKITICLDKDLQNSTKNLVTVDANFYNHLEHGYAATIHKAQGVTVDRSYLLASKYLDKHATYVGMSRHRESTDVFWGKDEFANKHELMQTVGRDRSKDVSLDYGIEKLPEPRTIEKEIQHTAPLTSKEIKERYLTEKDQLQQFQEAYIANKTKELMQDPLQAFKAQYEAARPDQAKLIQEKLTLECETKALAVSKEIGLLERAVTTSHTPKTYQRQLGQCAFKASQDKNVMNYLSVHQPDVANKITKLAQDHSRMLNMERSLGRGRSR